MARGRAGIFETIVSPEALTDQFGVGQSGWSTPAVTPVQLLVDGDVQCDDEVVEVGAHEPSPEVDIADATPTLGGLVLLVTTGHPRPTSESLI